MDYRNDRRGSFGGPREMHDAVCSECGAQTKVPFKPVEGRPVYCRDCYQKHKPVRSAGPRRFDSRRPREDRAGSDDSGSEEFSEEQ